jgi:diguanylate cyclase (GGDEF)-like protein
MKLKLRFFLLMTAIFISFVIITWLLSLQLINQINEKWGSEFIERQVLFDKHRTLSPLIHEIALAKKMAADSDIIQMALHESDPRLKKRGIAAMEGYRFNFRDHSYFAAMESSGNYYFNDSANQYQGRQLRYVLSPKNVNDKWFYATVAEGKDYQVNLDPDTHLGVTKVWINVLVKNGKNILGVIGTGIDLTAFLKETVNISQQGVLNLFIDKSMAIQLNADPGLIDYMSIAKEVSQRTKVDVLLKNPADIERLKLAIQQLESNPELPQVFWVTYEGEKHLLGLAYLPEIGWYDLTLMDKQSLALVKDKWLAPLLFCVAFLLALIAMGYALQRWVLKPISLLQESTDKIHHGDFDINPQIWGSGEISKLSRSFVSMAKYINDMNRELEGKVKERTGQLHRLTEYEQFRSRTLELLAEEASLTIILEVIVRGVEQLNPPMIGSILLLSSDGKHLVNGVSPNLPAFYNDALDGIEIGVGVGSCGTAAFTGARVIVEDIATHPYWAPYKELAHKAGIGACWSQPIISSSGKVMGTFAIYQHEAHTPTEYDIALIEQSAHLAGIAIERKAAENEIQSLAFFDSLTQLPNRRLLLDRLKQALASSLRSGRGGALLFIDLDNFKTLNDTLGHDMGDLLLQQVALRLKSCVRDGDTVSRLGGDEFIVMLEDLSEYPIEAAEQAECVGEKILATLNLSYQLATHEYRSTPSIGITLFSNHQQSKDELMKQADIAMYQAKKAGRNTLRFFDPQMQDTINARATLEDELRAALVKGEFELYYQIQVGSTHRPLGAEALIRWMHPVRGLVSPLQFIPLAEETGLILPIGKWVLETACAQLKLWQQDPLTRELILAVNVSAKQFRQVDFVAQVQAAVKDYAINPMRLKLELTESLLLDAIEDTIATMNALNEIGVQFSLDDFGTGYSSLQYLKRLPLDQLKIDRSFVRDLVTDNSDKAIVRTIIAMAGSLSLDVIAEGVETEEQRQNLFNKGCTHFQGYLFSEPIPIEQFEALLKLLPV